MTAINSKQNNPQKLAAKALTGWTAATLYRGSSPINRDPLSTKKGGFFPTSSSCSLSSSQLDFWAIIRFSVSAFSISIASWATFSFLAKRDKKRLECVIFFLLYLNKNTLHWSPVDIGLTPNHVKSAVCCVGCVVGVILCEPIAFGSSPAICRESGYKGLIRRPPRRIASNA